MAGIPDIPNPTSLPEVENLIIELYKPNPPAVISRIQEILQKLQKDPLGWQLAEQLLGRPDDNVKFFGALTIIVKINTESLKHEDAISVLQKLISWLITALANGTPKFIVKKLCSALVTYYIRYPLTWDKCIRHLLHCLNVGESAGFDDVDELNVIEHPTSPENFLGLIWFATALVEEANKIDAKSDNNIHFHESLMRNSGDVVELLTRAINPTPDDRNSNPAEAIACLHAWLLYAFHHPKPDFVKEVQKVVPAVLNCLPSFSLYEPAVDLLIELLEIWPPLFGPDVVASLYSIFESEWAKEKLECLLDSAFDTDSVRFGLFMLNFANAKCLELVKKDNKNAQQFLPKIATLVRAEGYPVADDKIFVPALEFWSTFAEDLVDNHQSAPIKPEEWNSPPLRQVMDVVQDSWKKIRYPPIEIYNSWDSTDRVGFGDARKDVADYLQSVYLLSSKPLFSMFARLIAESLATSAWADLEAAAFCLGSLSDCVSDGDSCDDVLTLVFGSPLFDLLLKQPNAVPVRVRQTCLSLVERYSDYFSRHAQFLPAALNLLFGAVNDRHLALPSSKSIHTLCSSCRSLLTSEVGAFLQQYKLVREDPDLDSLVEERVVGSIAAVIQAVPDDAQKESAFGQLLALIGLDIEASLQLAAQAKQATGSLPPDHPLMARAFDLAQRPSVPISTKDISLQLAIRSLRCLSNVAKGLQAPNEAPVDLEATDDNAQWSANSNLNQIHVEIMSLLAKIREEFSRNSEVVNVICSILRAGFSETEPGPFVFPPEMVTEFIISQWNSHIATVVNTAGVFVTSLGSGKYRKYVTDALGILLPWVISLVHHLSGPDQEDPELSQYCLEFIQKTMTKRPQIFMSLAQDTLELLFAFSISLLDGNEPLPKAAAAEFWTAFITLKADDQNTQAMIDDAMSHLGPRLANSLVRNIGGKGLRSELDKLSDPLKKLVVQHVSARQWLEAAVFDVDFPSDNVSPADKTMFIKKVISLRGSRATNQVVREFWLACRGSNFAYAS